MSSKFLSRKFIVTLLVTGLAAVLPFVYQKAGVSENVMLTVLAIIGGVGVAYGVINTKDASLDKKNKE